MLPFSKQIFILIKAFIAIIYLSLHSIRQLHSPDRLPTASLPLHSRRGEGCTETEYFIKKETNLSIFFKALPRLLPTLFETLL